MKSIKTSTNKYQHKLIILISTLNYVNSNLEQYTQNDILYYFNNNIRRNCQKEVKLKTLQNYLYKLEKVFKVTSNYHRHLGINMGTEVHYKLKYPKKVCYHLINKHFKEIKKKKYKSRVDSYFNKNCIENSSVKNRECFYNISNNKEEKRNSGKSIEKLQIRKYIEKCNFKSNIFSLILNLGLKKDATIEVCKMIKKAENLIEKNIFEKLNVVKVIEVNKLKNKQQKLKRILKEVKIKLENENYKSEQLEIEIKDIYEQYKNKPHFIIEKNKYEDLEKITEKLKNKFKQEKINIKENDTNIRNNIFNILIEQLRHKIKIEILIPILKDYLDKQKRLEYSKVFSNYYYCEILETVEPNKWCSQLEACK
ncbi:plasmid maintenance protein [Borreliella burgdorferi]|uniref:plasmid maintenance protein n=1 Tax=Borreliella burgdorferi TaxID=139 RepID=UPI00017F3BAE|nr:plasmid maintenance protein [Borreliella burgdorferi]ACN24398.1 hypothetical protein BBU64B_F0024 [Borreliella burgdorferi 64b]MCD2412250.1 plasmid maintenance protein [Borreliella burgdorferi]